MEREAPVHLSARDRIDCALLLAFIFAVAALTAGCTAPPSSSHMDADRGFFEAVAPEYAKYFEADPALTPAQKTRRRGTVFTWGRHAGLPPTATAALATEASR